MILCFRRFTWVTFIYLIYRVTIKTAGKTLKVEVSKTCIAFIMRFSQSIANERISKALCSAASWDNQELPTRQLQQSIHAVTELQLAFSKRVRRLNWCSDYHYLACTGWKRKVDKFITSISLLFSKVCTENILVHSTIKNDYADKRTMH
jgi:hypothetical protein